MRRVLFLDVDGVLNRCQDSGFGIEGDKVALLGEIVAACRPSVVVSSAWRLNVRQLGRVVAVIASVGGDYAGATPHPPDDTSGDLVDPPTRCGEILAWMEANGTPEKFAILDDDPNGMGHLAPHFVGTLPNTGITPWHAGRVIEILGRC